MREVVTKTIVYEVDELDSEAFGRAYDEFCRDDFYPSADDNRNTLDAFVKMMNGVISVSTWEYGYGNYINWTLEGTYEGFECELSGLRLRTWLINNHWDDIYTRKYLGNLGKARGDWRPVYSKIQRHYDCPLTGYYMDGYILDPIVRFVENYDAKKDSDTTLHDIMNECLNDWLEGCMRDYNDYYSEDNFRDMCHCNEWEFTVDGKIF